MPDHNDNKSRRTERPSGESPLIPDDDLKELKVAFDAMPRQVTLHIYPAAAWSPEPAEDEPALFPDSGPDSVLAGKNDDGFDPYTIFVVRLAAELAATSTQIRAVIHSHQEASSLKNGFFRQEGDARLEALPCLEIAAEPPAPGESDAPPLIRFVGAPLGEEGRSLIQTILMAGSGISVLSTLSRAILHKLDQERLVRVFTSGTCPYSPLQVILAANCALENSLITVQAVAADQFPWLSEEFAVGAVPHTVINGRFTQVGLTPEEPFVHFLQDLDPTALAERLESLSKEPAAPGPDGENSKILPPIPSEADLLILGAGPAGLTAAIYGARAGLKVLVLEKLLPGGQVALTPTVENYPGFSSVSGARLAEAMLKHASQYAHVISGLGPLRVEATPQGFNVSSASDSFKGKALLIATGGSARRLGIPGEEELFGSGVSWCALCDGYAFKNKRVLVVGGGNTALTDALYLKNLGAQVVIAHRRAAFRAENALVQAVEQAGINILWNTTPLRISGMQHVESVLLKNTLDHTEFTLHIDGVFVAVGRDPNIQEAQSLNLELNPDQTIKTDPLMRATRPKVYAAGDITGAHRQIVTAAHQGALAASTAASDLALGKAQEQL